MNLGYRKVHVKALLSRHWNMASALAGCFVALVAIGLLPSILRHMHLGSSFATFHIILAGLSGLLVWQSLVERMFRTACLVVCAIGAHMLLSSIPSMI